MSARKLIVTAVSILLITSIAVKAEDPVYFADANLKAVVEQHLGKTNPTPTDMIELHELTARVKGIVSLVGLEYATDLQWLYLQSNQISDLSPLAGLMSLRDLYVCDNRITDISPLSGLTNLQELGLREDQISDLSPLSGLTNLQQLHLSNSPISDLSPLSGLTNLKYLHLWGNQISDLSALSGLTNLQYLWLPYNQISDLTPLEELTSLVFLYLCYNPLNCEAYHSVIARIMENNPGIRIYYDPPPPGCENKPPEAVAGKDQVVEQESYDGTEVTLDGSGSTDPDSTPGTNDDIVYFDWFEGDTPLWSGETINYIFPLGSHTVTLNVIDSAGATDTDEVIIVVEDTIPPTIYSVSASPEVLWPANHKMVEVAVDVDLWDNCDPTPFCYILGVMSNEPINGPGDGNTEPNWEFTDDPLVVMLRAERAGNGNGRIYTIYVACADASGNTSIESVDVTVPHDQGKKK